MGSPQPCRPQHARCGSPPLPERPLQVKVVGLFSCPKFQIAKSAAEVTAEKPPSWAALPAPSSWPRGLRAQRLLELAVAEASRSKEGASVSGLRGLRLEDQEESVGGKLESGGGRSTSRPLNGKPSEGRVLNRAG
ncbi:hypothetical protein P7K49_008444, partial [Saguinus oedipus]